jgi:hypothetical protein
MYSFQDGPKKNFSLLKIYQMQELKYLCQSNQIGTPLMLFGIILLKLQKINYLISALSQILILEKHMIFFALLMPD